jgi:phosphotransferase system HPr (HPr) family protein
LHLGRAASLVRLSKQFHSEIILRCGSRVADLRSILSLLSLCATMGTTLDIETVGDDEHDAVRAVEQVFSPQTAGNTPAPAATLNL